MSEFSSFGALSVPAHLCCATCGDEFTQPFKLPCEHDSCYLCLIQMIKHSLQQGHGFVNCPVCRTRAPFSETVIRSLKSRKDKDPALDPETVLLESFSLDKDLQAKVEKLTSNEVLFAGSQPNEEISCDSRGCQSLAAHFCRAGCGLLCLACSDAHKRLLVTSEHPLVPANEREKYGALLTCKMHPTTIAEFLCIDCDAGMPMCIRCSHIDMQTNKTHHHNSIADVVKQNKSEMETLLKNCSHALSLVERKQSMVKEMIYSGKMKTEETCAQIRNFIDKEKEKIVKVLNSLDTLKSNLLDLADKHHREIWYVSEKEDKELDTSECVLRHMEKVCNEGFKEYCLTQNERVFERIKSTIGSTLQGFKSLQKEYDWNELDVSPVEGEEAIEATRLMGHIEFEPEGLFDAKYTFGDESKSIHQKTGIYTLSKRFRGRKIADYGLLCQKVGAKGDGPLQFLNPWGIACHPETGDIYVAEAGNHRIQILTKDLEHLYEFGTKGTGNIQFNTPNGIAISKDKKIAIADSKNNRVQILDESFELLHIICSSQTDTETGMTFDGFSLPCGLDFDLDGNLYIANSLKSRVDKFDTSYKYKGSFAQKGSGEGEVLNAQWIHVTSVNEISVVGKDAKKVKFFNPNGGFLRAVNIQQLADYATIHEGPNQTIFVSDYSMSKVIVYSRNGQLLFKFGTRANAVDGNFIHPRGICFGLDGRMYVCDQGNNRIQCFGKVFLEC